MKPLGTRLPIVLFWSKRTSRGGWAPGGTAVPKDSSELPDREGRGRERLLPTEGWVVIPLLAIVASKGILIPLLATKDSSLSQARFTDERSEERWSLLNREGGSKGGDVPLPPWSLQCFAL